MLVPRVLQRFLQTPPELPKEKVVDLLTPRFREFRSRFGDDPLSAPDIAFDDFSMNLSVRTYNCLRKLGVSKTSDIADLKINDLLRAKNFGVRSLVDLLGAVETAHSSDSGDFEGLEPPDEFNEELTAKDVAILRAADTNRLTLEFLAKRLPTPPNTFRFDKTALSARLIRRLDTLGVLANPVTLGSLTLLDLMQTEGFGKKSAVELVTFLEPYLPGRNEEEDKSVVAWREETLESLKGLLGENTVLANDQRFGRLLQNALPGASDTNDLVSDDRLGIRPNAEGLEVLKTSLERSCRLSLDIEIAEITGSIVNARTASMFCAKYAFKGGSAITLEETGHLFGVTRQRIEQACSKVIKRLFSGNYTPVLDRCLEYIERSLPNTADVIEQGLRDAGLVSKNFRLEAVVAFARLSQRQVNFDLSDITSERVVSARGLGESVIEIVRFARKHARRNGAARMGDILEHFANDQRFSRELIRGVVAAQSGFTWLESTDGWFWFADRRWNRVLNRFDKVFSVTDSVTLQDLRAAVRRHHRMQGISPPMHILKEMCLQDPELRVEAEVVFRPKGTLEQSALSKIEREMVVVMKGLGGFACREEFEIRCVEKGIARETFYMYIDNSSAFRKFTRGVYGLIGVNPSLAQIQSVQPHAARGQVIQDSGWISGNEVWVVYRLSKGAISTGMLSIPSGLVDIISDAFYLPNGKKIAVWTASICVGSYFEENHSSVGDLVALRFDLTKRTIQIDLDSELVEESFIK